jgi:hypothetical protein
MGHGFELVVDGTDGLLVVLLWDDVLLLLLLLRVGFPQGFGMAAPVAPSP